MSFTRMKFEPKEEGLRSVDAYPALPKSEDEARGQFQGLLDQLRNAINGLMAALENTDEGASGAGNIGVAPITGVTGTTVYTMISNLKAQIDTVSAGSLTDNIVETRHIKDANITLGKMAENSVGASQIVKDAVTTDKILNKAVSAAKLDTIQTITLDSGDTLDYDTVNNKLKLTVSGCTPVQLAPVVFGKDATPTAATYPPGTIYIQYVE